MKIFRQSLNNVAAAVGLLIVTTSGLVACDKDDDSPAVDNRPYTISGNANGTQVVPVVSNSGTATITGTYNPETKVLNYTSNWTSLSGSPVSGGLYVGAAGSSGIAIGNVWTLTANATGTVTGNVTLSATEAQQLLAGNLYYTYSTSANPSGEVRGQIGATR